jgi:hypothetical protein
MPLSLDGQCCCCNASPPPTKSQRGAGAGAAGGTDRPAAALQTQHATAGSSEHRRQKQRCSRGTSSTVAGLTRQAQHLSPAPCKRAVVDGAAAPNATARFSRWRRLSFSHVSSATCALALCHQLHAVAARVATALLQPRRGRRADGLQTGDRRHRRPRRQSIGPRAGTTCRASGLRPRTGARRRKISWTPLMQGRGGRVTWHHDRHQPGKERRARRRRTRAGHHVAPRLMNPLLLVEPHAEAERRRRRRLGALALQTLPAAVPGEPG